MLPQSKKRRREKEPEALNGEEDVAKLMRDLSDRAAARMPQRNEAEGAETLCGIAGELNAECYNGLPYRLRRAVWCSAAFRPAKALLSSAKLRGVALEDIAEQLKLECCMFLIGQDDDGALLFARTSRELPSALSKERALHDLESLRLEELKDYLDDYLLVKLVPHLEEDGDLPSAAASPALGTLKLRTFELSAS